MFTNKVFITPGRTIIQSFATNIQSINQSFILTRYVKELKNSLIGLIQATFSFIFLSICFHALKQSCILVQGFCPLGIKITQSQFPGGFCLVLITFTTKCYYIQDLTFRVIYYIQAFYRVPRLDRNSILCKDGSFSRHYEIKYRMMR